MGIIKKDLVKVEGNICEYPFFTFSKAEGRGEKKIYKFNPVILEDGKIEEKTLTLEAFTHGLPSGFDMDVLMAISRIGTEADTLTERTYFTLYEIAKRLGIPDKEIKIKEAIRRMYYVNCVSEYCILTIDQKGRKKKYLKKEDLFHIFDSVSFLDVKEEKNRRKSKEETYVRFNEFFVKNFFSGYFQYLDFSKYLDLETPMAKRLYIYLSKKRFGRSDFKISIMKLADIMPIEAEKIFKIRQILKKTCERLINQKVISGYLLEKGAMDITFYFPLQELKAPEVALEENEKNELYDALVKFGVSKTVARN